MTEARSENLPCWSQEVNPNVAEADAVDAGPGDALALQRDGPEVPGSQIAVDEGGDRSIANGKTNGQGVDAFVCGESAGGLDDVNGKLCNTHLNRTSEHGRCEHLIDARRCEYVGISYLLTDNQSFYTELDVGIGEQQVPAHFLSDDDSFGEGGDKV